MPQRTVPINNTHATCRVSVKNRAVLCVRSMRPWSLCCSDIHILKSPFALVISGNDADGLAIDEQRCATDDHALAWLDAVENGNAIAHDLAQLDAA